MFKRYLPNLTRLATLPVFAWVISLSVAQAADGGSSNVGIGSLFGLSLVSVLNETAAWFSHLILTIMSLWVTLTGALLNVSITLTLQIKDFVDSTQGVYIVWQTIRDISGMFIIFMLLYASFKIILNQEGGVGNLIKNVVIVGILINFSFFIVSLLIDASNIASLTLYRSIVVNSSSTPAVIDAQTAKDCQPTDGQTIGKVNTCVITSQMFKGSEGGISDIFLTFLKPQLIQNSGGPVSTNAPADAKPLEIIIQGVVGSIIMFTVGFSFLLAALAFIVRFIFLIILLAFSPIWFASWVIPQLADKAKTFTTQLTAQLIFMPVYLLLLYASLRILSASTVFTNPPAAFSGSGASLTFIPMNYIVLAVNDFFIIFLLNIPLVTAMSMGGMASEWINADKFGAKGMWRSVGKNVGGYVGTRTAGKWAGQLDKSIGNTRIGNTLLARDIRSATLGSVAKSKMGGSRNYEELGKAEADVKKQGTSINRVSALKNALASRSVTTSQLNALIKPMNEKERLSLGADILKNPEIAKHLKKSDFEAIKKSDDFTDEEKESIKNVRTAAFGSAVGAGEKDVVKHMMENMEVDDLMKHASLLNNEHVVANLKPGMLKKLSEEGLSAAQKRAIGQEIYMWSLKPSSGGATHAAYSFVDKNAKEWL